MVCWKLAPCMERLGSSAISILRQPVDHLFSNPGITALDPSSLLVPQVLHVLAWIIHHTEDTVSARANMARDEAR